MEYKDILNAFGGNTDYADRFQTAALQGDSAAMANIAKEYRGVQTTSTQNTQNTRQTNQQYTPTQQTQYNQGNGNLGNWNYGADTPERQEEIVSNLNQAYQQDPSKFQDWATFSQNFNYDYSGRSDKERETMRNWYSQMQGNQLDYNNVNNTDYFFNQFMQGNILEGTGAALDAARTRYNNWKYLSGMQPTQIASAIAGGSISAVGQEMQDLKQYSPALYAQVQAQLQGKTTVDDINSLGQGIYNGLTGTETNGNYTKYDMSSDYVKNASLIQQYNSDLYKKIESLGGDTAAYVAIVASMLQNPAIQASKNEVETLEGEVNKIQEQMYTIGDTVRTTLGSEAPEDLVSAYISQQTKQLQNQLRTTQNSLLVAQGKLDNQLTEVDLMLDAINSGIKMYSEGGTSSSDYQYISGTKYQKAGYFNKKTGEFIPLGGGGSTGTSSGGNGGGASKSTYVDTRDYQDDSAKRLQEITNNLNSLLKTNPELFKDRTTFNNYFKYGQRSTKQKQVLDAFWTKNKGIISNIGGGISGTQGTTTSSEDDKRRKLMKGIINGDVGGGYGKTAMKAYGFERELNEQEVMANIALICSPSEYNSLLKRLGTGAKKELNSAIDERIDDAIDGNANKIKTRLKSVNKKSRTEEAKKLAKELGINFGTKGEEHIMNYYNAL